MRPLFLQFVLAFGMFFPNKTVQEAASNIQRLGNLPDMTLYPHTTDLTADVEKLTVPVNVGMI